MRRLERASGLMAREIKLLFDPLMSLICATTIACTGCSGKGKSAGDFVLILRRAASAFMAMLCFVVYAA